MINKRFITIINTLSISANIVLLFLLIKATTINSLTNNIESRSSSAWHSTNDEETSSQGAYMEAKSLTNNIEPDDGISHSTSDNSAKSQETRADADSPNDNIESDVDVSYSASDNSATSQETRVDADSPNENIESDVDVSYSASDNSATSQETHTYIESSIVNSEPDVDSLLSDSDNNTAYQEIYSGPEFDQLFFGKWKIVELLPTDFDQPSSISGINADGSFRGPDASTVLGMEITFTISYVEYLGEEHKYVERPRTFSYSLPNKDNRIGYHYPSTLEISGEYYSIVCFGLPERDRTRKDEPNEIRIDDLTTLYLKDKNTIFASTYGGITYRLARIGD